MKTGKQRLSAMVGALALAGGSLVPATIARASTTFTRTASSRSTKWNGIATSEQDYCGLISGATINSREDAFDSAVYLTLFNSHDTQSTSDDAIGATFNYFRWSADATVVDYGATTDASVTGSCNATVNGQTLTAAVSTVFKRDMGRVIATAIVKNTSDAPFTGAISFITVLVSYYSTKVELTSSGDKTAGPRDTWVLTSEGGSEELDPIIRSFTTTPGVSLGPYTDINEDNGSLAWRLDIDALGVGESVTLTAGHDLFLTVAEAEASDPLTPPVATPPTPVPALSNPAILALAGGLGLFGAMSLSRRKRKRTQTS
ncbi:hypothetical protein N9Y37_07010 [Luminiphilus sp.]|nr:hypothetical protein [Luminiphilus sp.]